MINQIETLRRNPFLQIFTIYLRYLIGAAFIIAAIGMGKLNSSINLISSDSFPIDDSTPPLILFFKVMSNSGLYWHFIGWTQIIAGVLLLTQRYAKLGALIFFGLILNIFVITVSYNFKGTPIVTGLMLLSTIYLLLWDLKSFQFIFKNEGVLNYAPLKIADNLYWTLLGAIMIITVIPLTVLKINMLVTLGVLFVEGVVGLGLFFVVNRKLSGILTY